MRVRKPSPALVVAIIALVLSMTAPGIAGEVVDFARNSDKVDGKHAVGASSSLTGARGKLVATAAGGSRAGMIPGKFVSDVLRGNGGIGTIARAQDVVDNQTGSAVELLALFGFGTITSTCGDEANQAGVENPTQTITFNNQSGEGLSYARQVGGGNPVLAGPASGTATSFTIAGSNTFRILIQRGTSSVTVEGIARQDGSGTGVAQCFTTAQYILEL